MGSHEVVIPDAFLGMAEEALGKDLTSQLIDTIKEGSSPVSIRHNPRKTDVLHLENGVQWCPLGQYLNERPSFTLDPHFHGGKYYVQEASSMFIWHVMEQIAPNKEIRVLDLCAAPGGKSTLLASYLDGQGLLHSNEIIKSRAQILQENISKWGYSNCVVTSGDAHAIVKSKVQYDVILVDAPCSGEGLWRRDANAINEWSFENVEKCVIRQQDIINTIVEALAPGGHLIYSTCTYNAEENINNCIRFVKEHGLESVHIGIEESWGVHEVLKDAVHGYQFVPGVTKGEGFFCSVMKKEDGKKQNIKPSKNSKLSACKEDLSQWMKLTEGLSLFKTKEDVVYCFPKIHKAHMEALLENTIVLSAGTRCGELGRKGFIPSHALAMSHIVSATVPSVDVDRETALNYLRKQNITLEGQNGWNLIAYENTILGWIKHLGNRVNNYYPQNWRIRHK